MRMVLIRITKMLRGCLSLFKQEVAVVLEGLIVKMEELSRRPAQIEWKEKIAAATTIGVSAFNRCQEWARCCRCFVISKWARLYASVCALVRLNLSELEPLFAFGNIKAGRPFCLKKKWYRKIWPEYCRLQKGSVNGRTGHYGTWALAVHHVYVCGLMQGGKHACALSASMESQILTHISI